MVKRAPHLYRVAFQFYARDPQEAFEIVSESLMQADKVSMRIEDLDRRHMQRQVLGWGISIGVFVAAFVLYCIGQGEWVR